MSNHDDRPSPAFVEAVVKTFFCSAVTRMRIESSLRICLRRFGLVRVMQANVPTSVLLAKTFDVLDS